MYDFSEIPEVCEATDQGWAGIAKALRREGEPAVRNNLSRDRGLRKCWGDRDTLVCGLSP